MRCWPSLKNLIEDFKSGLTQHQADGARSAPRVSGAILGECFSAKECVKPRSLCESLGFKKWKIKSFAENGLQENPFHPAPSEKILFCVFRKIWSNVQAFSRFCMSTVGKKLFFKDARLSSFFSIDSASENFLVVQARCFVVRKSLSTCRENEMVTVGVKSFFFLSYACSIEVVFFWRNDFSEMVMCFRFGGLLVCEKNFIFFLAGCFDTIKLVKFVKEMGFILKE